MKATVPQTDLVDALKYAVRATTGTRLPVLNNILIEAHPTQSSLHLTATNLEQGLCCRVPAEVKAPGALTVPAKTLQAWVKTIDPDRGIHLTQPEPTKLRFKAGAQSTLTGIAAEEFPPFPEGEALATFTVAGEQLLNVLTWTGFAVAKEEIRLVLTGICMVGRAQTNTIELYSADGFRAGKAILPCEGEIEHDFEVVMPAKALSTLSAMRLTGPIEVQVTYNRRVRFSGDRFDFWLSTIEAQFPDVNQVIPTQATIEAQVNKAALQNALRRVRSFSNTAVLFFDTCAEDYPVLEVRGESVELGQTETRFQVELYGKAIVIGFNAQYLADIAAACPSDNLVIELTAPENPALIRPQTAVGEQTPLWVLMPMHLGNRATQETEPEVADDEPY